MSPQPERHQCSGNVSRSSSPLPPDPLQLFLVTQADVQPAALCLPNGRVAYQTVPRHFTRQLLKTAEHLGDSLANDWGTVLQHRKRARESLLRDGIL